MYKIGDKLSVRGAKHLSDCELLALLLGDDDTSMNQAQALLDQFFGSIANIALSDITPLRMIDGIGLKRAQRLVAAAEWGRRCALATAVNQVVIETSADVVKLFRPFLEGLKHEECWVLYLNSANRVVERSRVSQGGITATVVDHRLVVKRALELLATKIVLVHNHPSGSADPSDTDIAVSRKIKSAAALFDIKLLDHLIIAKEGDLSLRSVELI